jgi:outer membrane protein
MKMVITKKHFAYLLLSGAILLPGISYADSGSSAVNNGTSSTGVAGGTNSTAGTSGTSSSAGSPPGNTAVPLRESMPASLPASDSSSVPCVPLPKYPGAPDGRNDLPGSVPVGVAGGKSRVFNPETGMETTQSDPGSAHAGSPDDSVELRPAPLKLESASTQSANSNPSANAAMNGDFEKHKNAAILQQKSLNKPAPSGASGEKSPAVFTTPPAGTVGPSKAASGAVALDEIQLNATKLQSLITVNNYLNPFQLDASTANTINLRQALITGLDQNLDLAISRTNTKERQFAFFSSLGNFLPDPTFGYSDYLTNGRIGLPVSAASLFGSSAATTVGATGGTAISGVGSTNSGTTTIRIHSPFQIMHAGMDFYAYRGGSVLFGALQAKHNYKAAKHQEKASLSDTLMIITQNYYNLVLAEALLQIRVQAVRTSEEQLRRNLDRFHSGLATNLDVLQSRTQLSRDRQALVDQQISRRSASISLSTCLNIDLGLDLKPVELVVKKVRLVDPRLNVSDILQLAIDNRPELKQYEELRMAAKRSIMVAGANLQPSVLLSGNAYGIGPPSNVQALGVFAINANWRLRGFGTVDGFDVQQARWQARQASLQSQKQLQTVLSQVRNSYLQILDKEKNIEQASDEVNSSLEELRLAELRKSSGLGLNLDIITAQRDYTQALVDKAQAIINFDIAQAQLVHDTGLISVDALTSNRLLSKAARK